jgi:hypothetical protein
VDTVSGTGASPDGVSRSLTCAFLVHLKFIGSRSERFAVKRCGRRQAGGTILRRCHCGDHICCNGMFDGGKQWFLLGPALNSLQLPVLP